MRITKLRHPEFQDLAFEWDKYRYVYKGGREFVNRFLKKYSKREDTADFQMRRGISFSPSYAKAALNKIKNSIYQRMAEIVRIGGPANYQASVKGDGIGVDLHGASMNRFIGQVVLPELLSMGRVGIWVDKPTIDSPLLINNKDKQPYVYHYKTEDICSWSTGWYNGEEVVVNILLKDSNYTFDQTTGLAGSVKEVYRHAWLGEDNQVHIQLWEPADNDNDPEDKKLGEEIVLPLPRIPFVFLKLSESLLTDVADHQIALLNLESSDLNYALQANFPFYTEQVDPNSESVYTRRAPAPRNSDADRDTNEEGQVAGTGAEGKRADKQEVKVGTHRGRKYMKGMDRPDFIAPPTAPLEASMKKQEQIKREIYDLVNIALANSEPQHASADSKAMDDRSLESGLSYIGLELEYGEREIAKIWGLYENKTPATVTYPSKYSLKSDAERRAEAEQLLEMIGAAPSKAYAKEIAKQIAYLLLSGKVENKVIEKIAKEIDTAEWLTMDIEKIQIALEAGIVDAETASNAAGFDGKKVVPKAQKEHAERLKLIADSQANGAARGVPDRSGKKSDAKLEKKNSQKNRDRKGNPADPGTRGKA